MANTTEGEDRGDEFVSEEDRSNHKDRNRRNSNNHDFVIRDGFPALYLPVSAKSSSPAPWIEGTEPIPRHRFWATERALDFRALDRLEDLRADCVTVFSARTRGDDRRAAYSAGDTYFVPCRMEPRCALEALALSIFRKHTEHLDEGVFAPELSGAEWWTLVLDDDDDGDDNSDRASDKEEEEEETAVSKDKKDDGVDDKEEDEGDDEVALHFDADYGLEEQVPNLLLHPRLATVTYLTNFGAPTVVFDQRSPPPKDIERKTLQGSIRMGWLSEPRIGKHVAFDGRLLHGSLPTYFPNSAAVASSKSLSRPPPSKKAKLDRKRITFLVNVWLNHCPSDAELLDEDVCESLKTPFRLEDEDAAAAAAPPSAAFEWTDMNLVSPVDTKRVHLSVSESDPAGEEEVVLCSRIVTVTFGASMEDYRNAAAESKGGFVQLDLDRGVVSLEVGDEVQYDDDDDDEEDNDVVDA